MKVIHWLILRQVLEDRDLVGVSSGTEVLVGAICLFSIQLSGLILADTVFDMLHYPVALPWGHTLAGTPPKWLLPCNIQWVASANTGAPPKWLHLATPRVNNTQQWVQQLRLGLTVLPPVHQQQLQSNRLASCIRGAALHSSVPAIVCPGLTASRARK